MTRPSSSGSRVRPRFLHRPGLVGVELGEDVKHESKCTKVCGPEARGWLIRRISWGPDPRGLRRVDRCGGAGRRHGSTTVQPFSELLADALSAPVLRVNPRGGDGAGRVRPV